MKTAADDIYRLQYSGSIWTGSKEHGDFSSAALHKQRQLIFVRQKIHGILPACHWCFIDCGSSSNHSGASSVSAHQHHLNQQLVSVPERTQDLHSHHKSSIPIYSRHSFSFLDNIQYLHLGRLTPGETTCKEDGLGSWLRKRKVGKKNRSIFHAHVTLSNPLISEAFFKEKKRLYGLIAKYVNKESFYFTATGNIQSVPYGSRKIRSGNVALDFLYHSGGNLLQKLWSCGVFLLHFLRGNQFKFKWNPVTKISSQQRSETYVKIKYYYVHFLLF